MKRVLSLVMVVASLLGLMLVPASAIGVEGTGDISFYYAYNTNWASLYTKDYSISFPRSADYSTFGAQTRNTFGFNTFNIPPSASLGLSGAASVYISFFICSDAVIKYYDASGNVISDSVWLSNYLSPSSWSGFVYDLNGSVGPDVDTIDVKTFTPQAVTNYSYVSHGVTVNLDFDLGDEVISGLHVDSLLRQYCGAHDQSSDTAYVIPSIRIVSAEVAADIAALENIADGIVEGNAILGSFYGDVMSILNQMYARMGSMEQVQQTANSYLSQIVQKLNDIDSDTSVIVTLLQSYLHYLEEIAGTASDIAAELELFHSSFSSAIDYLVQFLGREFGLTRDAIEDAVDMLIQYLDSTFASAINPDLGQADSDLNAGIDNNHAIEQKWTGSLATDWESLQLNQYNFDSDYTNAFMVVSLWFSNIFNAFGAFGSVLMFPMVVGICMLILGVFRMGFSRSYSGRNQSKGGGSGA